MAKLSKAQRNIVIGAVLLIIIAWLFPPYKEGEVNDKGELTGWHAKWKFNQALRDVLNPPRIKKPDGSTSTLLVEYMVVEEYWVREILGILVLAGAAYLITKKKPKHNTQ